MTNFYTAYQYVLYSVLETNRSHNTKECVCYTYPASIICIFNKHSQFFMELVDFFICLCGKSAIVFKLQKIFFLRDLLFLPEINVGKWYYYLQPTSRLAVWGVRSHAHASTHAKIDQGMQFITCAKQIMLNREKMYFVTFVAFQMKSPHTRHKY